MKLKLAIAMVGLGAAALAGASPASAATEKLPNITPFPASELRIVTSDGQRTLRFSTITWNKGAGHLELRGTRELQNGRERVVQRIYWTDGTSQERTAGYFEYHSSHNHTHFNNYAKYVLRPVSTSGVGVEGAKTTFCVMDTNKINTRLPGASKRPRYKSCDTKVQGMSVGWADKYGYWLDGQSFNISHSPDGTYDLVVQVDPTNAIKESDEGDNVITRRIRIAGTTVTVIS